MGSGLNDTILEKDGDLHFPLYVRLKKIQTLSIDCWGISWSKPKIAGLLTLAVGSGLLSLIALISTILK